MYYSLVSALNYIGAFDLLKNLDETTFFILYLMQKLIMRHDKIYDKGQDKNMKFVPH